MKSISKAYLRTLGYSAALKMFDGRNGLTVFITCGQSYKGLTIVNYDSRVVIWGIFKSGTTLDL